MWYLLFLMSVLVLRCSGTHLLRLAKNSADTEYTYTISCEPDEDLGYICLGALIGFNVILVAAGYGYLKHREQKQQEF